MFQCCSLETSHPRLLPQSLKDCSMNLCILLLFFFFCSAYRVIINIFLNSDWCLFNLKKHLLQGGTGLLWCYHHLDLFVFFGQSSLKSILLGRWGWGTEVNYWCCWKTFWFLWKPLSIFQQSFVPRDSSAASPLWKEQLRFKTTLWKQHWPNNQCITIGLAQCHSVG